MAGVPDGDGMAGTIITGDGTLVGDGIAGDGMLLNGELVGATLTGMVATIALLTIMQVMLGITIDTPTEDLVTEYTTEMQETLILTLPEVAGHITQITALDYEGLQLIAEADKDTVTDELMLLEEHDLQIIHILVRDHLQ
jgi:hypothetical protein